MGWKAVKDYYRIEGHLVQVCDGMIWIGSSYIPDIIMIDSSGRTSVNRSICEDDLKKCLAPLKIYFREFNADPQKLAELVQQPDKFESSITVYTYEDGMVIERKCEQLGYPHCTHDGERMYDNTHSANRSQVVAWAKFDVEARVERIRERIAEHGARIQEQQALLEKLNANLGSLLRDEGA